MPTFRVHGDVLIAFIHTIDAPSAEDAENQVERLKLRALDNTDGGETRVQGCIELDEDGNEIE
jgi:hypothetical protein